MVWVRLEGCGNAQGMTRDERLKYFMKYWNTYVLHTLKYVEKMDLMWIVLTKNYTEEHKEIFGGEG